MPDQPTGHGGKRPGAGRKPTTPYGIMQPISTTLPEPVLAWLGTLGRPAEELRRLAIAAYKRRKPKPPA